MSLLIESIKLLDGKYLNLDYHERRMQHALQVLRGTGTKLSLKKLLAGHLHPQRGLFKCRIVYDELSNDVGFVPYEPKHIRTLKVIEDNGISYEFKFADRSRINRLFELRGACDDILIVRDQQVTDCSFSNIVFRTGSSWVTPEAPLLKGTMRQKLLDNHLITERVILGRDISSFETYKIINAMLEFDSPEIEVSNIVF
jgi:4-amino-4-deoxychorismate lyase